MAATNETSDSRPSTYLGTAESLAVVWPLHEQQSRKNSEEQALDPGRHVVGGRRPELNVDDEDREHDGAGDEHHREEEVLADQRGRQRGRRVDLHHLKHTSTQLNLPF